MEDKKEIVERIKNNDYPKSPVFTHNTDKAGRIFKSAYSNIVTNIVFMRDGKNYVMPVKPYITERHGDSQFGEEIILSFIKVGEAKEYPANSPYETIEAYLPREFGLKFLRDALDFFEGKTKNKEENPQRKL